MPEEILTVRIQVAGIFVTISANVRPGDGQGVGSRLPTYIVSTDDERPLGRVWRVDHGEVHHTRMHTGTNEVQAWWARREPDLLGPFPDTIAAVRALLVEEGITL